MEGRRVFWGLVLIILAVFHPVKETPFAAGIVKANGVLTSIEDDRIVMIDDRGYEISPSAEVIDHEGNRISLRRLVLPAKVDFIYEFTKEGPIIRRLKEIPRVIPK